VANAVSALHGDVARRMWSVFPDTAPITHITNAQHKGFWADAKLEAARTAGDIDGVRRRKRRLKERLFREVADQTGKLFDPDVLTIVWARRFAGYKRADLITRDDERFRALLRSDKRPVQVIWAGKPFPADHGAIDLFNHLIELTREEVRATVLVGYELFLSRLLKSGADVWLNTPVVTREASGTSGMSAAMNGAVNLSTDDGWICEFARSGHNSFIVPPAPPGLDPPTRDDDDRQGVFELLEEDILPVYYDRPDDWWAVVLNSMSEVAPAFDSARMADQYYSRLYSGGSDGLGGRGSGPDRTGRGSRGT
jgi:starch phosphorylase